MESIEQKISEMIMTPVKIYCAELGLAGQWTFCVNNIQNILFQIIMQTDIGIEEEDGPGSARGDNPIYAVVAQSGSTLVSAVFWVSGYFTEQTLNNIHQCIFYLI